MILLCVFAVSTAVAWAISVHRGTAGREAADILAEIRDKSLASYWARDEQTQWYLIRHGKQPVGYRVVSRKVGEGGAFEGSTTLWRFDGQRPRRITSSWTLTGDGRQGRYESSEQTLLRAGAGWRGGETIAAVIVLKNDELSVSQKIGSRQFKSTAVAPENYLPEGMSELVLRQTAERKGRAVFKMVIDSHPPAGGRTRLISFELEYAGPADEPAGGAVMKLRLGPGGRLGEHTSILDHTGLCVKQIYGNIEEQAVGKKEVLKIFPHAARKMKNEESMKNVD